jgi:hypothetical protein
MHGIKNMNKVYYFEERLRTMTKLQRFAFVSTDFQMQRKAPFLFKSKENRIRRFVNKPATECYVYSKKRLQYVNCSFSGELTKNKRGKNT